MHPNDLIFQIITSLRPFPNKVRVEILRVEESAYELAGGGGWTHFSPTQSLLPPFRICLYLETFRRDIDKPFLHLNISYKNPTK